MTVNRFVLLKRKEKWRKKEKEKEERGRVPNKASLFSRENKSTNTIVGGQRGHRSFRSGFLGKNRVVPHQQ